MRRPHGYTRAEWKRIRACTRKRAYHTEDEAQRLADKWGQAVYHCKYCDKWHLTSTPTEAGDGP